MTAGPVPGAAPIASHAGLREAPGAKITAEHLDWSLGGLLALLRRAGLPPTVGVARDARPAAKSLAARATELLLARGVDVVDMGVASTPAAKLASRRRELGGLAVITGSHLAAEHTGLKLAAAPTFKPLDHRRLPPADPHRGRRGRLTSCPSVADEHVAAVAAVVDQRAIRAAALRVSATGGPDSSARTLLARLGCGVADAGEGAELGFVLDADGDRLRVAAGGTPLDSELTLPLVALARRPRLVVRSSDTSRAVDRMLGEGARVEVVPPGELNLVEALLRGREDERPALAGEGNGGVVVPDVGLARDGLATAAVVLELVARSGRTVPELVAELPALVRRRSALPAGAGTAVDAALAAAAELPGARPAAGGDGVLVERAGGAWALVRRSATEPLLRLTVEGPAPDPVAALHDELRLAVDAALGGREPAGPPPPVAARR